MVTNNQLLVFVDDTSLQVSRWSLVFGEFVFRGVNRSYLVLQNVHLMVQFDMFQY